MNDRVLSGNFHIYIYIYIPLPSPSLPNSLRLRPSLIRPSLLSSASRLRRPPARRRRPSLPCLSSALSRASFPLTKNPSTLTITLNRFLSLSGRLTAAAAKVGWAVVASSVFPSPHEFTISDLFLAASLSPSSSRIFRRSSSFSGEQWRPTTR